MATSMLTFPIREASPTGTYATQPGIAGLGRCNVERPYEVAAIG